MKLLHRRSARLQRPVPYPPGRGCCRHSASSSIPPLPIDRRTPRAGAKRPCTQTPTCHRLSAPAPSSPARLSTRPGSARAAAQAMSRAPHRSVPIWRNAHDTHTVHGIPAYQLMGFQHTSRPRPDTNRVLSDRSPSGDFPRPPPLLFHPLPLSDDPFGPGSRTAYRASSSRVSAPSGFDLYSTHGTRCRAAPRARVHVRFVMDMHERLENRTLGLTSDSIKAVSLRKDVACPRHRISKP